MAPTEEDFKVCLQRTEAWHWMDCGPRTGSIERMYIHVFSSCLKSCSLELLIITVPAESEDERDIRSKARPVSGNGNARVNDSVEKQKSYITMDALMPEGKKMDTQDILLVPRPTSDHLDALVQPLQPNRSSYRKY